MTLAPPITRLVLFGHDSNAYSPRNAAPKCSSSSSRSPVSLFACWTNSVLPVQLRLGWLDRNECFSRPARRCNILHDSPQLCIAAGGLRQALVAITRQFADPPGLAAPAIRTAFRTSHPDQITPYTHCTVVSVMSHPMTGRAAGSFQSDAAESNRGRGYILLCPARGASSMR